jgi:hypothetical protein
MTTPVARRPSGFDYGYRPASYFDDLDPNTLIVASILGEERRKDVQQRLASGDFDPLVWGPWITESKLDDSIRRLIGQAHPRFMGGEYLPALEEDEIEIARIVVASVMQDVTCVRARREGKGIAYRIVNEHENEFTVARKSSTQPLSLGELIDLIEQTNQEGDEKAHGIVFSILDWNLDNADDPEDLRYFISVSSSFYPELGRYYDEAIARYLEERSAKNAAEEEEEEAV